MDGRALRAVCLALIAAGCSQQLDRQSLVTGLRVLAVSAEPPEVAAGEEVALTALWHDLGAATPTFRWSSCAAPLGGGVQGCAGPESAIAEGEGRDAVRFAPRDEGTALVRVFVCAGANGERCASEVEAAKRVIVGEADHPNRNPVIEALRVTLPAEAGDDATVELVVAPDSIETNADGTEEELFVSWFATAGEFELDRSFGPEPLRFETAWTPPPEAGEVLVWAVLRDGRGGVSWAETSVQPIEPP